MVGQDNVTFRFKIDSKKAEQAIRELEAIIKRLGGTTQRTGTDINKLNNNLKTTSQSSAASAVNFQTATQGALNLSTAAVQTYTSISNLDRANNRAKMSVIAVARAEDLLANKLERQNAMRKAGEAGTQKFLNISKEIATAEADLTVKIEKRGIEQAAVNDIYMLFATNIANVTISSMQTLAVLDKNQVVLTHAKTFALRVQNMAIWSNIRAMGTQVRSITLLSITSKIGTAITLGFAGSIRVATAAVRAFAVAHPALIAITAIMTGALIAYEANILGLKDAINSLLPKQVAFQDEVDNARNSVGGLDEDLGQLGNTVKVNFSKSLEDATSVALAFKMQIKEINNEVKTLDSTSLNQWTDKVAQFHNMTVSQPQKKTKNFFDDVISFFSTITTMPEAYGAEMPKGTIFAPSQFDKPTNEQVDIIFGLPLGTIESGIKKGTFTEQNVADAYYAQQASLNPLKFIEQKELELAQKQARTLSPEILQALKIAESRDLRTELQGMTIQSLVTDKRDPLYGNTIETGIPSLDKRLYRLGLLTGDPAQRMKKTLENVQFPGVGGVSKDEFGKITMSRILEKGPIRDAVNFAGITDMQAELKKTQYIRLLAAKKGVGGSFTLTSQEQKIFDKIGKGEITGNRAEVLINTGEDIGSVANSIDLQSALLLGAIQDSQRQFNRTSADPFVSDFDKLSRQSQVGYLVGNRLGPGASKGKTPTFSDVVRMSTLEAQQYSVRNIAGIGGRADAAIAQSQARRQIEDNMTVRASQGFYDRIRIKDRNTNLLRFGGRLREGMTIEEEGAVVGGYSSVREFSAAARAQREIAWTTGKALAASFGQVMPSGYISGQGWKTHSTRLANRASEMKSALSSAGLSFKNVGYLDMGYRWTAQQANRAIAEHSAAVAFNNNQYAKATQINLLEGGFDLSGFRGTSMDLPSLQDKVLQQDDLMKSIGLTRTEAFQIIDTQGRGREEIDDRVKWKSRLNSMSTGTAVL